MGGSFYFMPELRYNKKALAFKEQIKLLKNRGLIIENEEEAISFLSKVNYYRFSGYSYLFRSKEDKFLPDTTFDTIVSLYEFDRNLRLLVLDGIERIEIHIRTLVAYRLGHSLGAFGYCDSSHFKKKKEHKEWLEKADEEKERSSEVFVKHYNQKYKNEEHLPIWMVVEIISFGSLSRLYSSLKSNDRRKISENFKLHHKRLANWLYSLTSVRNISAHHGRIWNRGSINPKIDEDWKVKNNHIFSILLIIRYLLKFSMSGDNWKEKCNHLIEPISQREDWSKAMGLPENWKDHPIWK